MISHSKVGSTCMVKDFWREKWARVREKEVRRGKEGKRKRNGKRERFSERLKRIYIRLPPVSRLV